jgi:chromosomal replication initiator protein
VTISDAEKVLVIRWIVAHKYGCKVKDLIGQGRHQSVALPRHIAMYLIRLNTVLSLPELGHEFGGRNHASVLHGIRRIAKKVDTEEGFAEKLTVLNDLIKNGDSRCLIRSGTG